ncbi:MAG: insulinase family protein, partial [Patescibacteria group bacterium]
GISYTNKNREALSLLAIILGGNMSSRLFINVRERLGLCYFIRAGLETYEDAGAFVIQAGLDLSKIDKALAAISRELKDIKQNGVKADELNKAKQYVKGKTDLGLEESLDVASFFAKQALFYKKIQTPEQAMAKIMAVKIGDIQAVANEILDKKRLHIATLAPFKDINKFAAFVDI